MDTREEHEDIIAQVEAIIEVWLEYDATGDPSVFTDADVFAEDIMHNPPDNPTIRGLDEVLDYLESFDPTVFDWEFTIADIEVGRDLVVVELSYRGRPRAEADPDGDEVDGTSIDVFRRHDDGTLKQLISSPSPAGVYPI